MGTFWNTQPVDRGSPEGIIDNTKRAPSSPIPLPEGFSWTEVSQIPTIVAFLDEFYVEDITSTYRLTYSRGFFEFLFASPAHKPEYSLGLRCGETLVGYVLAREHTMSLRGDQHGIVSVNFLCLAKEHRNRQLAPLMIKEIRRRANMNGVFQAIFTAEKDYGFGILTAGYYHYPLNGAPLVSGGIIDEIDDARRIPECRIGTRLITDCSVIRDLYDKMCKKFLIHEVFEEANFQQTFGGKKDVLHTIYNPETSEFASFYIVFTNCIAHNVIIKRAYLYYWHGSIEIVKDAISVAHSLGVDMFDLLDVADNSLLVSELPFAEGTGSLKYHVFNIKEEAISKDVLNFILF